MEPKTDREHLLVLGTKFDMQMELLEKHVQESKEVNAKILGTLQNHNDRINTIEQKSKPAIFRFFKAIFAIFSAKYGG